MEDAQEALLNILFLARCLASADGEFATSEKKAFQALIEAAEVDKGALHILFEEKQSIATALSRLHSKEAKMLLVDVLLVIACADGVFEEKEKIFMTKVMNQIGLISGEHPLFEPNGDVEVNEIFENMDVFIGGIREKAIVLK